MLPSVHLEANLSYDAIGRRLTVVMRRQVEPSGVVVTCDVVSVPFDLADLRELEPDLDAYGIKLGATLFGEPSVAQFLQSSRDIARSDGVALRFRLVLNGSDPVLARIHWERVIDPAHGDPIALNADILLSRFVTNASPTFPPPQDRELRALIAIASPSDLTTTWGLPLLDRKLEADRICQALSPVCSTLVEEPVTFTRVAQALGRGWDVLFIMCHGNPNGDDVWLLLETEDGTTDRVRPQDLVNALAGTLPRLALIASCSSANHPSGRPTAPVPAALAHLLVERGVPAVVGITGAISTDTASSFFHHLLESLREHGDIDLAVSEARRSTLRRHDWSAPVVFSALRDGKIGWPQGPAVAHPVDFDSWDRLAISAEAGNCIPVIGLGLLAPAIGEFGKFVEQVANAQAFPLHPPRTADLGQVTRFLETQHGRTGLLERYATALGKVIPGGAPDLKPEEFGARIAASGHDVLNSYRALARLRSAVYITTDPFDTLAEVLRSQGAEPVSDHARWKRAMQLPQPVWLSPTFEPTPEKPFIYHLFGRWTDPNSLVITDDDILGFLLAADSGTAVFPEALRTILRTKDFLFLGFELEGLDFRSTYRSITSWLPTSGLQATHVAAQVSPSAAWARDPNAARDYLAAYFNKASVSVHWVSAAEFLEQFSTKTGAIHNA